MELRYPSRGTVLFAVALALTWATVGIVLRSIGTTELTIHYTLMYVSFLGVVEFVSPHRLRPPLRNWLNLTVTIGFFGWVLSLIIYIAQ